MNDYAFFKGRFEAIKPIRGRAVECRPIGVRRRDWETIRMEGDVVCCRLYRTDVIKYHPDGVVELCTDGYQTNSTAAFMDEYSPFRAFKAHNKVQVRVNAVVYPLPDKGSLKFHRVDREWQPVEPIVIKKEFVDRAKAKEAREKVKPFLDFVKTFLAMSDGWIMHKTRMELVDQKILTESEVMGDGFFRHPRTVYETMATASQEYYLPLMMKLFPERGGFYNEAKIINDSPELGWWGRPRDVRIPWEMAKERLYGIVRDGADVHVEREIEPGNRPIDGAKA